MEESNIQLMDMENYVAEKEKNFSHQELVMKTMRKALDAGCKEMRSGYWNKKHDKFGGESLIYIEDTRKAFIESVSSVKMSMACDIDEEAEKILKEIEEDLNKRFKELCKEEQEEWNEYNLTLREKRWNLGIYYKENKLNKELSYHYEYIEEEVKASRKIFEELTKLTKRLDFYSEEMFEA